MTKPLEANINIQGWGFPYQANHAHYFNAGNAESLCGKWQFTGVRVDVMHEHKDNCVACMKKRKAQLKPLGEAGRTGSFREIENPSTDYFRDISETSTSSLVIPDGWVLVPIEPTTEMLNEIELVKGWSQRALTARYKAMVSAAPNPGAK